VAPAAPVEIGRIEQVDDLPLILGGLLALLATVAVGHAVIVGVRRRRFELAVLRTIGFERRQVRAAIAYQSTILTALGLLVGVPVGIAVGRVVWQLIADGLGITPTVDVSLPAVALVVVGALLAANLVGALAATAAVRDRPATALAAE
jgi:ABC-type lipoprotein release transport system permease subunit